MVEGKISEKNSYTYRNQLNLLCQVECIPYSSHGSNQPHDLMVRYLGVKFKTAKYASHSRENMLELS